MVTELMSKLKSHHPLLVLSLESMIEEMIAKFKPQTDEELFRIVQTLLGECYQQGILRITDQSAGADDRLPQTLEMNLRKISMSFLNANPASNKFKEAFDRDFITNNPTFLQVIDNLRKWRDRLQSIIDKLASQVNLENCSKHLAEFHRARYEGNKQYANVSR